MLQIPLDFVSTISFKHCELSFKGNSNGLTNSANDVYLTDMDIIAHLNTSYCPTA